MDNVIIKERLKNTPRISYEESLKIVNLGLWSDYRKRQSCLKKAVMTPLPGPLLGAFMDKAIQVRDKSVCRIVPAHFFVLQKIESKLLDMLSTAEANSKAVVDLSTEEIWDCCWIFTQDPERIFNLVAEKGIGGLREESKTIALLWQAEEIDAVMMAIFEQLKRHIETKAKLLSDMKSEGNITFFQEPEKRQIRPRRHRMAAYLHMPISEVFSG